MTPDLGRRAPRGRSSLGARDMLKPWYGGRRIAFVPVSNSQVDINLPPGFADQVWRRAFFDPDPATQVDRSLQAYIRTVSSGYAHIDGAVLPPVVANGVDTMGAAINALPPNHSYDLAVAVLPHASGPHRGGFAWWDNAERNGINDWCRVALYQNTGFTTRQGVGVWAMEVLHSATHIGDLYNVSPSADGFDVMSCSCGTHPSANTKAAMGWLHLGALRAHQVGTSATYTLHAGGLPQPPPPGRLTAVTIKSIDSAGYFLVEARMRNDTYEMPGMISSGIPVEGVVVYEIQGLTQVFLRRTGLVAGGSFSDPTEGLTVRVTSAVEGGFRISITSRRAKRCAELLKQIEILREAIDLETDIHLRKQLISALTRAMNEYRELGCVVRPVLDTDVDLARTFAPLERSAPGGGSGSKAGRGRAGTAGRPPAKRSRRPTT